MRKWGQKVSQSRSFEKGSLLQYGYSPKKSEELRHKALREAIDENGANNVWHKLDFLAKMTQNSQPNNSETYSKDAEWISEEYL